MATSPFAPIFPARKKLPFTFNIKKSNTQKARAAFQANTRNTIVAFMGDSTMRGVDETSLPYNNQYSLNAMPMQLAAKFNAISVNAGANNWYGLSGTSLNDYVIRDSRIAVTAGALDTSIIQGGTGFALTAAGSISFTPTAAVNTADIYQYDFFAGATVSWQVDGGAATNIVQAGSNTIIKTTIPLGAAGTHTITINWVSGNNSIFGIDASNNTGGRKEITMRQWGISGATSASMIDNSGAPHAGRTQQLTQFPADLVISECGLVNSWRNSESVANSLSDMNTLVTNVKAAGTDFIFLVPPHDNSSTGLAAQQDQYVAAMYQSAALNDVGLIDLRKHWVSYSSAVSNAWQVATDAVHPTKLGYGDEVNLVFPVVRFILGV